MPIPVLTGERPTTPRPIPAQAFPLLEHFRVKNVPPAAYYIPDFISPDEEAYLLRKLEESPQPKWKTAGSGRRLQYWGGTLSKNAVLLPEPLPEWMTQFPPIVERIQSFLQVSSGSSDDGKPESMGLNINQVLVNEYSPGQGISPHEDGPAFRPLVATVSLGSHTVLDIHQYLSTTSPSPPMVASEPPPGMEEASEGRPIAAVPMSHLLLMPRSLLILTSSLYASHLHAIQGRMRDSVVSSEESGGEDAVCIANADLLGDAKIVDALRDGGAWEGERGTRTSLTFRQAEKILKGGSFSMAMGGLRRS